MLAVQCVDWGLPETLVINEVPEPEPKANEVRITVHAAGVNFPDVLIIQKKYQYVPELPFSPGGEVAGVVSALGSDVKHLSLGQRVIGSATWGGYAQAICVDAARVIPMPEGMDFQVASAYVLAYGTSLHALKDRAKLQAGETVLVLGAAGGVGIAAVAIAKAMGATVIAAASSAEKLALCQAQGADHLINVSSEDVRARLKEITGGRGPNVIYDPVGGALTEHAFRSIAWEGRHLVVGFAAGDIPKLPLNLCLLKSADMVGVFWGGFLQRDPAITKAHMRDLFALYLTGKVTPPITHAYPLREAKQALRDVLDRKVMGKVVILPQV